MAHSARGAAASDEGAGTRDGTAKGRLGSRRKGKAGRGETGPAAEQPASLGTASARDVAPSLDPAAIERAYLRERARRRARSERHATARNSDARFWVVLAVLALLAVVFALIAWHEIQTTFGI